MRISDWSSDVCSSDLPDCLVGRSWQTGVASRPPHPPARLPAASTRAAGAALAQTVRGTDRSVQDGGPASRLAAASGSPATHAAWRSEEHTSELQSLMRISYAVFCLKKKKQKKRYATTS